MKYHQGNLKYLSTFSGAGGFELGIGNKAECIGFSEIDKYASQILKYRFPKIKNYGDITTINIKKLPDFDLLVGGFPCQSFSIAGKRGGFKDTRGTLFFYLAEIAKVKRPKMLLFENVKGLMSHDESNTFATIISTLDELGYDLEWCVINGKNFGVPQNRERVFIVGHLRGERCGKVFPIGENDEDVNRQSKIRQLQELTQNQSQGYRVYDPQGIATNLASQAGGVGAKTGLYAIPVVHSLQTRNPNRPSLKYSSGGSGHLSKQDNSVYSLDTNNGQAIEIAIPVLTPNRLNKRQNGRRFKDNGEPSFTLNTQDQMGIFNGSLIRRLTPKECERLMSWPDEWTRYGINDKGEKVEMSDTQRYKMCGNGVISNCVKAIIDKIVV